MAQQHHSSSTKQRQIITKGYLMKQGNLLNKSFKNKYFILYQGRILCNFETEECVKQIGEIDLSQVSSITYRDNLKSTAKCKYVFDVITPSKTWTLGTIDKRKCDKWVVHLRESAFGNTLFSGWLYKRGGKVQTWKHRFFVLSDTKILRYYEDEECTKYKGFISLNAVIKIQTGDPLQEHDNIIYMTTPSRIWCISAPTQQSQQEWIEKVTDGQNQINYDEKASIFVNINQQNLKCRGNVNNGTCLAIERIKFVCCIYLKWLKSHKTQQEKNKELRASMEQKMDKNAIQRANTIKIQSYSSSISDDKIMRAQSIDMISIKNKHKLRKGMFGIINSDLKEYNNKELLNDLNHILEHHDNTKQFESLYKYLLKDDHEEKQDSDVPLSVSRIFRSRFMYSHAVHREEQEDLYFNYNEIAEIATQQLLDKIYSYLLHSFNICRLRTNEIAEIQQQGKEDGDGDEDDDEYYIEHQQMVLSNTKHALDEKRTRLHSAAMKDKLQLRSNKFIATKTKRKKNAKHKASVKEENGMNIKRKSSVCEATHYTFGNALFFYWESCKKEEMYVCAKYNDLKDELLNNSLCNISLAQFDTIYHKSNDLHDTDRALIIGAFCGWKIGSGIQRFVQRYGIPEGTPIKINHILASVIYCNYYELAERYRSTYTVDQGKHNEFAHFSRYLVECVLVFGAPIKHKMCLYHAIDGEDVILHDFLAKYIAPISMTAHFEIVWSYTDNARFEGDGLMVKLIQQDNLSAFSMDCSWLSDFVFEYERIAVANTEAMRVDTIIHMKQYTNYNLYIHAINSLSNLLSSTKPLYETNKVTLKALNKIITYKFNKHKVKNNQRLKVPRYIDILFETKCLTITWIECDLRQIFEESNKDNDCNNGCYSIFRSLLIDPNDDWIKIDLFVMLFPNLSSITIRCFNHLIFNDSTCNQLCAVLKSKIVKKKDNFRIEFDDVRCSTSYDDAIKIYYKTFKKLNYELLHVNESIILRKQANKKVSAHIDARARVVSNSGDESGTDKANDDADCIVM